MIPLFLERVDAEERRFIRSAPQNAILSHAAQGSQTQGISKPHPRKGTETTKIYIVLIIKFQFQNHIPARGRKQGDLRLDRRLAVAKFQNHIPARGRKHVALFAHPVLDDLISKPHPRKGTETCTAAALSCQSLPISKPHPRKGTETPQICARTSPTLMISKPHPRKGTETTLKTTNSLLLRNFKTTSPQGDGNS